MTSSEKEQFDEIEKQKDAMLGQAQEYLDVVKLQIEAATGRRQTAINLIDNETKLIVALSELKVTWLERCAAMLRIDAVRHLTVNDDGSNNVSLVFADTDGDPVLSDDGDPTVVFESLQDIAALVVRVPKKVEEPN